MFLVVLRIVIFFAVLTAIYLALDWYMRGQRIRELEAEHASGEGTSLSREDYVAKGIAVYSRSWQRKALLGIFAAPIIVIVIIAALANYA
ncbi:MAG: hypothetical protein OEN23_05580 [Paracoccaceae bacterium]|nr:hypothetical protein [Paracoccaceae bacterium]